MGRKPGGNFFIFVFVVCEDVGVRDESEYVLALLTMVMDRIDYRRDGSIRWSRAKGCA